MTIWFWINVAIAVVAIGMIAYPYVFGGNYSAHSDEDFNCFLYIGTGLGLLAGDVVSWLVYAGLKVWG